MMNRHARERRIVELKAQDLPALTWLDIFTPAEGSEPPTEAQQSVLDAYFARFVAAPKDADGHTLCICCQKRMLDGLMGLLGGLSDDTTTIEWGLAHGEAHCRACGWPSRVYANALSARKCRRR